MNTIRALHSMPDLAALNIERMNSRSSVTIASGFQPFLQTQLKLSGNSGLNEPAVLKQSISMPPHRADIDSLVAQLLASRKMLLQPFRPVSFSGKQYCEHLRPRNVTDGFCREIADVSKTEYVPESVSGSCEIMNKKHPEVHRDSCSYLFNTDFKYECQQTIPVAVMAPLTYFFIGIFPDLVRISVSGYIRQPLRIRRLRRLDRTGYRQNACDLNLYR